MPIDWTLRMREDWDARARQDAEYFIYTRDEAADLNDFALSGQANYNQLVRPYLPMLLNGRPPAECHAVEIGCGIGRMTEFFARDFARIDAIDVAPIMIERAQLRLGHLSNVHFHVGNGSNLATIPDASADLVFSYIVFQHIPSREAIESYIHDAARVLRPGGALKVQLNGDQSEAYRNHQPDTWLGQTFSSAEALQLLSSAGLNLISMEGAGTQYLILTARKGSVSHQGYVLPGEGWAEPFLLKGFGPTVDDSWRPIAARARVHLPAGGSWIYLGLYFWPESCRHTVSVNGHPTGIATPGDHLLQCETTEAEIEIHIDPPPSKQPAFRIIGRL